MSESSLKERLAGGLDDVFGLLVSSSSSPSSPFSNEYPSLESILRSSTMMGLARKISSSEMRSLGWWCCSSAKVGWKDQTGLELYGKGNLSNI